PVYSANYHISVPCSHSLHLSYLCPVKKSSVATAPSFVPSLSSSLPTAALSTYKPALTSCAPVTKTRKKRKFFPTNTILPVSKPVSLPSENPPSVVQPDTLMPDDPVYPTQLDVSTQPDGPIMPDDSVPRCRARRSNA
ncbi:unnamed protein product, partial [Staurois parvus]